jgi:hypothetical protein
MSDIAKTMADRIRNAANGSLAMGPTHGKTVFAAVVAPVAPTGKAARQLSQIVDSTGTPAGREQYAKSAAMVFEQTYGVTLDSVTDLFTPKNDIVYANAEQGVLLDEFTRTLGSQMSFNPVGGKDQDYAKYVAGENRLKLALAEYAYSVDGWTFTDGYAVTDNDGSAVVVAPAYDETINAWQFSAYSVACDMDSFVAMSAAQKASTPSEGRVFGDIDDCVQSMFSVKATPSTMRM